MSKKISTSGKKLKESGISIARLVGEEKPQKKNICYIDICYLKDL